MASQKNKFCGLLLSLASLQLLIRGGSASDFEYEYITCGSSLKLLNTYNNVRLHSHDVKYGSGSGQQSVTGVEGSDDHNSYWQVLGKTGLKCPRGKPVKCGQTIRLMHVATRRNLHSHHFDAPLSKNLEVSAFGENGLGDDGDHWVVVCDDMFWSREERVRLKHVVTDNYLHVSGKVFGRPIRGQMEISGHRSTSEQNYWQAAEGIYIMPSASRKEEEGHSHDEF